METPRHKILWADDEIDLLRSHHMYLNERGYEVTPVSNGEDALEIFAKERFDLVLLDEMMPGLDGLSTLEQLKHRDPNVPVIMITKNEEEHLMDEAIGRRIDDYLTKPVNPSQIFMACKKILDARQIRQSQAGQAYVTRSQQIRDWLSGDITWRTWIDIHRMLCEWDIEISRLGDASLQPMIEEQRRECNHEFVRFVEGNYPRWVKDENDSPPLSVDVVSETLAPHLESGVQTYFIVIDCLRLDHWMILEPMISEFFNVQREYHYSVLPTATPYSRNALFSGLFPLEIAAKYRELWSPTVGKDDETSLNRHEHRFLDDQIKDMGIELKGDSRYVKVIDPEEGRSLARKADSMAEVPLVAVVYNFLDMLVHGRSHSALLKEIAPDERGFRSLVLSWFENSSLFELLKKLARSGAHVVITTDHGAVRARQATLVHGDRQTSTSLRYKHGKNLRCEAKDAIRIDKPETYGLPPSGLGANYIIAKEDYFFVYPTKFNEYSRQYRDSFQHGGISLEEMILPVATLIPK